MSSGTTLTSRAGAALALATGLLLMAGAGLAWYLAVQRPQARQAAAHASLRARLAQVQPTPPSAQVDCTPLRGQRPLVLLVLGQSNAANHASPATPPSSPVLVMQAGVCSRSTDPLPGGTGAGSSLWTALPAALQALGTTRPVLIQLLAVDATFVGDWVRPDSPLRERLLATLAANRAAGWPPDLVLLQMGEADGKAGTPAAGLIEDFQRLADLLANQGIRAPVLVAQSTVCRSGPRPQVRLAIDQLGQQDPRFLPGPDTDPISDRLDGCHWGPAGRLQAASLWAAVIQKLVSAPIKGQQP